MYSLDFASTKPVSSHTLSEEGLSLFNKVVLKAQRFAYTLSCISEAGIKYLPCQSSFKERKVYMAQVYYGPSPSLWKNQRKELKITVAEKQRSRNVYLCSTFSTLMQFRILQMPTGWHCSQWAELPFPINLMDNQPPTLHAQM